MPSELKSKDLVSKISHPSTNDHGYPASPTATNIQQCRLAEQKTAARLRYSDLRQISTQDTFDLIPIRQHYHLNLRSIMQHERQTHPLKCLKYQTEARPILQAIHLPRPLASRMGARCGLSSCHRPCARPSCGWRTRIRSLI